MTQPLTQLYGLDLSASWFDQDYAQIIIQRYDNTQKVRFKVYVTSVDEYGNHQEPLAFSMIL